MKTLEGMNLSLWTNTACSLAAVLALGCGPSQTTQDSETGETGETGETSETGTTDTTGTDTEDWTDSCDGFRCSTAEDTWDDTGESEDTGGGPIDCGYDDVDHELDCPSSECAITVDMRIECDDSEFAAPGLRVAPQSDLGGDSETGLHLVTASSDGAWFVTALASSVEFEELDDEFIRQTILMAQDSSGTPYLALDSTNGGPGGSYPGGVTFAERGDVGWVTELVFDNDKYVPPVDFEVDYAGRPHLWYSADLPDLREHAVREGGQWSYDTPQEPAANDWLPRFGISADDLIVALNHSSEGSGYRLQSLYAGESASLGPVSASSIDLTIAAQPPNPPLDWGQPIVPYAVARLDDNGIDLMWPTMMGGDASVSIPGSMQAENPCNYAEPTGPGTCPMELCIESQSGMEGPAMAMARTNDGRVWIAWVESHLERTWAWQFESIEGEDYCWPDLAADESTATLHLLAVNLDSEQATEVLTLDSRRPGTLGLFSSWNELPRMIDARAYGGMLAIGLREGTTDPLVAPTETTIRTLLVDTSQL